MLYQNLLIEIKDRIQYITINRESKLNALNKDTLAEMHNALIDAFGNNAVWGVIITGAGERAFVAGADISEFASFDAEKARELSRNGHHKIFDLIENGPKPVVAAINGFALGGGLELAMACHIRIAADNAKMGLPEVTLGLIPGYGGTQRLTQLVGKGKAMEMVMTGDMISADEAYQNRLVNYVVPQADLLSTAEKLLNKILSRAPLAIRAAIKVINASTDPSVNGFEMEIDEFAKCFDSADFKEGATAFLEKRKPVFKGE